MFPKITSPCPVRFRELPNTEKNHCTLCDRSVHNLNAMNQEQRLQFLQSCGGKVCVAYSVQKQKNTVARTAGLILSGMAALAAGTAMADDLSPNTGTQAAEEEITEIIVGGVMAGQDAQLVASDALAIPELAADAPELEFVAAPSSK